MCETDCICSNIIICAKFMTFSVSLLHRIIKILSNFNFTKASKENHKALPRGSSQEERDAAGFGVVVVRAGSSGGATIIYKKQKGG